MSYPIWSNKTSYILKKNYLNKDTYLKNSQIPKLNFISFNFHCENMTIKTFAQTVLALELLTGSTSIKIKRKLTRITKYGTIFSTNVHVILKNKAQKKIFSYLVTEIFSNISEKKLHNGLLNSGSKSLTVFFSKKDILAFKELEQNMFLFNNLPLFSVTLKFNKKLTFNELSLILEMALKKLPH